MQRRCKDKAKHVAGCGSYVRDKETKSVVLFVVK